MSDVQSREAMEAASSGVDRTTFAGHGGTSAGRRLAAMRAERGLALGEVARHLKFTPRQIEALEHDEYALLPGSTVIRGMVRSYAKLLMVDAEPLLDDLKARLDAPPATVMVHDIAVPFPARAAHGHRLYWVLTGAVVIGIALFFLVDWLLAHKQIWTGLLRPATATAVGPRFESPASQTNDDVTALPVPATTLPDAEPVAPANAANAANTPALK